MGDIPLDFDTLQPHGCFIGSAAVVILSDQDKARDAALNLMRFFDDESCGQCTPCRVGTAKALDADGSAASGTSRCSRSFRRRWWTLRSAAWGRRRRIPALSVMKYFPHEVG